MKTVGFVTIRLNSKRVPQKNIKNIGGKPLCWHIVNTLLRVNDIDDVYVYCSDPVIKQHIPDDAIFLQRDEWLDGDEILAKDTYSSFINEIDADIYIAACTTSPFTKVETIKAAINYVKSGEYDSAFTVKREQTFAWYMGKPLNYSLSNVPRTQDIEPVFIETSAFFVFRKDLWTEYGRRIGYTPYMIEVDHIEAVDIDTQDDLNYAEIIARALQI